MIAAFATWRAPADQTRVAVRKPASAETHAKDLFGPPSLDPFAGETARLFATVTGKFTLSLRLSVTLYHVQNGKTKDFGLLVVGRSPNVYQGGGVNRWGFWQEEERFTDLAVHVGWCDERTSSGRRTAIGTVGHERGAGWGAVAVTQVESRYSRLIDGPVALNSERVLYVEGDAPVNVDGPISLLEFANRHRHGNYLVAVIGLSDSH